MELKSFRDTVDFVSDLGLFSVVFEHEFSWLHRELMNDVPSNSPWGHVVEDVRLLLNGFNSWKSSYCIPLVNKPARALARHARNCDETVIWMEDFPSIIESLLYRDIHM
jgi:hypothetical protein